MQDLVGFRHERILVESFSHTLRTSSNRTKHYWNIVCDCGKTKKMRSDAVKGNKSCGCATLEAASSAENIKRLSETKKPRARKDLKGEVFGRLTAIEEAPDRVTKNRTHQQYYCDCSCGNTMILVDKSELTQGNKVSCGCVLPKDVLSNHKDKSSVYVEQAHAIHGDKYDLSRLVYKSNKGKVIVGCPYHGDFKLTVGNLLLGQGCPTCGMLLSTNVEKISEDPSQNFILRSKRKFGEEYTYDNLYFLGNKHKVTITCRVHGDFEQNPQTHLGCKVPCPVCRFTNRSLVQDEVIQKFKKVHGNIYDYSEVKYKRCDEPVEIICGTHGIFLKNPSSHILGEGCQKCSFEESASRRHWNYLARCDLDPNLKSKDGYVYLIKMKSADEVYLKVGISCNWKKRLNRYTEAGIEFELLSLIDGIKTKESALIEKEILDYIKDSGFKYRPTNEFKGYTECADISALENLKKLFLSYGGELC